MDNDGPPMDVGRDMERNARVTYETSTRGRGQAPVADRLTSASPALRLGTAALVVLVCGFGSWAVMAEISGAVIASGHIAVETSQHTVQHVDGGTVAQISVRNGDVVEQGDLLARLDGADLMSERTTVRDQVFELMARKSRLLAEQQDAETMPPVPALLQAMESDAKARQSHDSQLALFESRKASRAQQVATIRERIAQLDIQVAGLADQAAALREQIVLMDEEIADQERLLSARLTQKSRFLSLNRARSELKGRLGEVTSAMAERRAQVAELDMQIVGIGTEYRERAIQELAETRTDLREGIERLRHLESRIARLDITAPVSGVVHDMQVTTAQSVLRAAEPFLSIVPLDQSLVISARIDALQRDKVHPGQLAAIRFPALDQNETPEISGILTNISPDALEDERTGARFYDIRITIPPEEAGRFPAGSALFPGMPADAFIQTSARSPMAYLTKPAMYYVDKAFRED